MTDPTGSGEDLGDQVAELIARQGEHGLVVELGIGDRAGAAEALEQRGLQVARVGLDDLSSLADRLDVLRSSAGEIRAMCLLDLLDRLPEPERLLHLLSEYAAAHDDPLLIVSAPNVGHQD